MVTTLSVVSVFPGADDSLEVVVFRLAAALVEVEAVSPGSAFARMVSVSGGYVFSAFFEPDWPLLVSFSAVASL